MRAILHVLRPSDGAGVLEIFNHYVIHGFAAYTDEPLPPEDAEAFLSSSSGYPALVAREPWGGRVIGFGMLRPYSFLPVFVRTAEITCFVRSGQTGRGIGSDILQELCRRGRGMGIASIVATISSLNEGSIRFHLHHGFRECGRLSAVGEKFGRLFDVVYCQKEL